VLILWIAVIVVLTGLSALVSAMEAAIFSVAATRLTTLRDEGFEGAEALAEIRRQPPSLRGAIHVVVSALNFAVLGMVILVGVSVSGPRRAAIWLVGAIPSVLFLTEVLPRAMAGRGPVRLALVAAPLFRVFLSRLGWLLSPFMRLEAALSGRSGDGREDEEEREVREIAILGREAGIVNLEEHVLVERAFKMDELTAWDVMTPRVDVFAWKDSLTVDEIIPELPELPYSRVPVYGESVDDITGILYVREAYQTWAAGDRDRTLSELAREPFFIPGSMSLAHLMRDFRGRRVHMGIVADEFGGTDGLVTLEDALEELVGEIVDETDVEEEDLHQVGHDEWVADGGVDLRDVNQAFDVDLPATEYRSLNGFILDELGYVPEAGETLSADGVLFEILEASDTHVVRARIRRSGEDGETDDENG
jgi:CBS domain containing-hemolysin-like protein